MSEVRTPPIRLVISGATGRMGRTVGRLAAADPDLVIIGGIDREGVADPDGAYPELVTPAGAGALLRSADAVIDFSAPALLEAILRERDAQASGVALIVGTTGLGQEIGELLDADTRGAPVLTAANFSIGVNLLVEIAETVSRALPPNYDVEIVEAHHRRKEDAPSGTALALGDAVARGRNIALGSVRRDGRSGRPGTRPAGEIGFHAVRGGDVVGDHHVHFLGDLERLELVHRASDRSIFAAGALHAAKWLTGRPPGRYTMRQVLGL